VKRLADEPFVLLGVNSDSDREAVKKTIEEEGLTWRSWWDDGSTDGPIQTQWQIEQRPALFILDDQGIIRHKQISPEQLDEALESLLRELKGKVPGKAESQ
jgi:hypothetical protein